MTIKLLRKYFQLVILALLGCCVVAAHSASLSDSIAVGRTMQTNGEEKSDDLSNVELSSDESSVRDKRSGSGGFLAGIGSAILGKVAQASGGLSSGSSDSRGYGQQYESVEYGPPVHGYDDDKNFDIWSFKKAILNTLFQALKAIGGGVIALKGKLIKGGGVVISAKGNIISAKGEAISTLGRHIAASAVLTPPKTTNSYVYEAPVHVPSGHDSYGGHSPLGYNTHGGYAASPSSDSYGHSAYASPSDDAAHPGLLIVKPANQQSVSSNQHPVLAALSQSFGGSQKSLGIENIISKFAGASNSNSQQNYGKVQSSEETHLDVGHSIDHVEHKEYEPISNYGSQSGVGQNHQETHVIHNEGHNSAGDIHSDEGKLDSTPIEFSQYRDNHQQQYQQFDNQNLGFKTVGLDALQLSHNNYVPFENGPLMFSGPLEMPILQNHNQANYHSAHNQFRDLSLGHNSYNQGLIKRSSRPDVKTAGVRTIPSIVYSVKNSRLYRI